MKLKDAGEHVAGGLLVICGTGLAAGALMGAAGAGAAGAYAWAAVGAAGAAYALWEVVASLRRGRFGVDLLALLAVLGALLVGERLAAAVIALMLASGRSLESWAGRRASTSLRELVARAPKQAHRYRGSTLETVPVELVVPGDSLMVPSGEVVPVDGVLLTPGILDESALTGEALPLERRPGEEVKSGAVNVGQVLQLRATAPASESTYAGIVRLVRAAQASKAPLVRLADRFALWFLALGLAAAAAAWPLGGPGRSVAVLVVTTPCPLILATPVALVAGLARCARRGVVVKGGGALERLAQCRTLIVDKTGTLTSGRPRLSRVASAPALSAEQLLCWAGSLEQASAHLFAAVVVQEARARHCELVVPSDVQEAIGKGIKGRVGGHEVAIGNQGWVALEALAPWAERVLRRAALEGSAAVFVAVDGDLAGVLLFDDPVRKDAAKTLRRLRRGGIGRIVVLSGDRPGPVEELRRAIGADEAYAACTPAEKLEVVRKERAKAPTLMVGDGINDAPALAMADIGAAIAARGASASSEVADVVVVADRLASVGDARAIAARARRVALQSAAAGVAMSLAAMGAAMAGVLPALWGALLQEGIDVAVILNALRALRPSRGELRLTKEELNLTARFLEEHKAISADIEALAAATDALETLRGRAALRRLREVQKLLVNNVQPHEEAEETLLYPALDSILGGHDATAPMSVAHSHILQQIRRFVNLLGTVGPEGPNEAELAELRDMLVRLHAVLELHTAQEDQGYLSLGEGAPGEARAS